MTRRPERKDGPSLTAVVLTLDEETHLPDCLRSLRWVDRLLVLDSGSRDRTVEIARDFGARVEHHAFENYSRQRQRALELVTTPWTLFVDADERVSEALATEVRDVLALDGGADGYWVPRRNDFWGHALRGGGWWPDPQLRLIRTSRASYDPDRAVHEVATIDGATGRLTRPLVHLNYASPGEFRAKQRGYVRLEADRRATRGDAPKPHHFILQPLREATRRFVRLGGWRDGPLGAYLAIAMAWYELRTLVRLAVLDRRSPDRRASSSRRR